MGKAESMTPYNSVNLGKRQELVGAFREKYNFRLDIPRQPRGDNLALLIKLQHRRPADFLPLSRVAKLEDGRDLRETLPLKRS